MFPKFCALAQQRVPLHTRNRISCNFGVIIPQPALMRKRKNAARAGTHSGTSDLPGSPSMHMRGMGTPACFFERNDGHSPAPNGPPPVRTGQQFCPNRSPRPKKAETGFFPPLRPQRLSCIISIIPRGRCKMAPRAAEALPIRRRQRRERFHPSAPVNTGSIASLSLPQRAAVALTHRQNFYC